MKVVTIENDVISHQSLFYIHMGLVSSFDILSVKKKKKETGKKMKTDFYKKKNVAI